MDSPKHIAIIMDGNGRWAKKRGMPRTYGHTMGAKTVEKICRAANKYGVKYLTLYAFSTENWSRPETEVKALMKLLGSYLENCLETARENQMRIRVIGDISKLDPVFQEKIHSVEEASKAYDALHLTIAINYGSRDEMIRAMRAMAGDVQTGKISPEEIDEKLYEGYLDTKGIPDPDLMIRTSGEQRLSNYLLWQLAYSEFYFTDKPWPDFDEQELAKAIEAYCNRDRRYGALKED